MIPALQGAAARLKDDNGQDLEGECFHGIFFLTVQQLAGAILRFPRSIQALAALYNRFGKAELFLA